LWFLYGIPAANDISPNKCSLLVANAKLARREDAWVVMELLHTPNNLIEASKKGINTIIFYLEVCAATHQP